MRKIVEAQILSQGHTKLKLTLSTGEVIQGYTLGMVPALAESDEEIDFDVVAIEAKVANAFFRLKEEDICKVEKVS